MSSLDNIYQKMVPTLEPATLAQLHHEPPANQEPQRLIAREVAHELNNILTIIQGYADRLIMKHGADPELRPDLQLISDNARRAVGVIRKANPRKPAASAV
jgi:signal transduction histidine kinase